MITRDWKTLRDDLDEQEYCKKLYLSGEGWTQKKLAELYGVSYSSMQKFIQSKKWSKKKNLDNPTNKRKFSLNDNFFSQESPVMAYWLGFIAADGYCRSSTNEVGIGLARADREHLEKFKKDIEAQSPIKDYTNNLGYENSKIAITSKKIREDLCKYGIIPQKTFTLQFPTNLNKKYWVDFIRGYFDGDGCISYLKNQHALRWQICGVIKDFLQQIIDFLYEEYDVPKVKVLQQTRNRNHTYYYFQYSTKATERIFDILYYDDSCRRLDRKYNKFKKALEQHLLDII